MLIFFVFVTLLVFEVIVGKVIENVEQVPVDEVTEINLFFEEEQDQFSQIPETPREIAKVKEPLQFSRTDVEQTSEKPEDADFQGEQDTTATSDSKAEAGQEQEVALSGDQVMKEDIITKNSNFTDGDHLGAGTAFEAVGIQGKGKKANDQVEDKMGSQPTRVQKAEEVVKEDPFKDLEGVNRAIEDRKFDQADPPNEAEQSNALEKMTQSQEESPGKLQVAQKEGASNGGFKSKQNRTRIRGILNAQGEGSLDVENTELGRYEAKVFKQIEREWQARNFQFRSHLAPGLITLRFLLDEEGAVSGQRRIEMRGASDIQWGVVLNAVSAAKIPAMPIEVRKELGGESLELTVTFNY